MKDWLASKGKKQKDYAAFARNWLRKDFNSIGKPIKIELSEKNNPNALKDATLDNLPQISEEQRQKNIKKITEMKKILI